MNGRALLQVWILALIFAALAFPAAAVNPDEILSDSALEARARDISSNLRCLVCQNQSIDDSDAPLARDLRLLVRERLQAGDKDEAVVDFIVARYGEFVLLRPRFGVHTIALWLGPLVLVLIGGAMALRFFARRPAVQTDPLSEEEKRRLQSALKSRGD